MRESDSNFYRNRAWLVTFLHIPDDTGGDASSSITAPLNSANPMPWFWGIHSNLGTPILQTAGVLYLVLGKEGGGEEHVVPKMRGALRGSAIPSEFMGGLCWDRRNSPTFGCTSGQPKNTTSASGGVTNSGG